ncbi:protein FAM161B isoform X1 [Callorhinchus milii]|uniref:protein FAM161B isoform X1 n=1 Tax=Callorhinchus milii TaxID=7868 RepID=UPI001C3F7C7E|nr:protein FAM161B isoform X1 [Callorhinchus milii]XP_042193966.1 protein FAM161B isoform X1 [Callorhinchus milii]
MLFSHSSSVFTNSCVRQPVEPEWEAAGGGLWEDLFENASNYSNEPTAELNGSNTEKFLEFLRQEQTANADDQNCDQLLTLSNVFRQRLLELGTLYDQHKSLSNLKNQGNMRKSRVSEEQDRFFSVSGRRILADNRISKLITSGWAKVRKPYPVNELKGLIESQTMVAKICTLLKKPHKSSTSDWMSQITDPKPFHMTIREDHKKNNLLKSKVLLELQRELIERQKKEDVEFQRKFHAHPIPAHVYLSLFNEMNEYNKKRRRKEIETRKELLKAMQKPFSFTDRQDKRKEELSQQANIAELDAEKKKLKKKIPKSVQDATVSEKLKEEELLRKIRIQMRAADLMKSAAAPINTEPYKKSLAASSLKAKDERLGFLQEEPKFKPRINMEVPDFDKLYEAFQRDVGSKHKPKEATKCEPFEFLTAKLRAQRNRGTEVVLKDSTKNGKPHLTRDKSYSAIASLSSEILPMYISDTTRKRQAAIRKSLEEQDVEEQVRARWMESYNLNSQLMSKGVLSRAKAMDPHQSLEETYKEKLQKHRKKDSKRKKEYKKELEEMKRRVLRRPYLFEQVTQKNATKEAERRYRDTLHKAGVDEEFVWDKGRCTEHLPLTISDEEDGSEPEDRTAQTRSCSSSIPVEKTKPGQEKGEEIGEHEERANSETSQD